MIRALLLLALLLPCILDVSDVEDGAPQIAGHSTVQP